MLYRGVQTRAPVPLRRAEPSYEISLYDLARLGNFMNPAINQNVSSGNAKIAPGSSS
jgi:hypothetical protein